MFYKEEGSGRRRIQSLPFYVLQNIVFADSTILTRKNVNTQGNIEGGVHRGDLFVDDDGSIYVMSITTEWQNAPCLLLFYMSLQFLCVPTLWIIAAAYKLPIFSVSFD